jgi:cytochrome c biogenesis protein CcmG, thiol:disulfide interchange protein DsbE
MSGCHTLALTPSGAHSIITSNATEKNSLAIEMDYHMSELVDNAQAQGAAYKHKRRRRIVIICVVSLLNIALVALILSQLLTPAPHSASDPLVNQPAPNFSLALLRPENGKSALLLSNFKGKAVVLNFWASWCDPCKEEAPLLEKSWKQMQTQGKDVAFVGIDYQDSSSNSLNFLQQNHITYPIVVDMDGSVATKYGLTGLPQTFFIDRNGKVLRREAGELTSQLLASGLQMIM